MPTCYRQGDILLILHDQPPGWVRTVPAPPRQTVAEGEVTGHAHVLEGDSVRVDETDQPEWIEVPGSARLVHEEHAPVDLGPGTYRVVRQREYTWDDAERAAAD
jgi:hypothetical protein